MKAVPPGGEVGEMILDRGRALMVVLVTWREQNENLVGRG